MKEKSFSVTLRRKRIRTFTLQLLTPSLFILRSLEKNVTSTSHPNVLKDGCDTSIVGFETTFRQESDRLTIRVGNLLDLCNSLIFIILIS